MDPTAVSHCPNCLAEYRQGFETCADCAIALVPGPAPEAEERVPEAVGAPRLHGREETPVVLCSLPRIDAQVLAGKLQDAGLTALADEPALMSAYGAALPDSRLLRVWVVASELDEARAIARRALAGDDAI